jgi:L-histidine N-alpha-methyltransferase
MYLEAITDQNITLPNDESISINSGEKILTEISRKFTDNTINMLFSKASLNIVDHYNDKKKYFSLYLLKSNQYS